MTPNLKSLFAGLILSAGVTLAPASATGNDTLIRLLEVLRDNGTINEEAYRMLLEAAKAERPAAPSQATEQAPAPAGEPATTVDLKDSGLEVESKDAGARLRLGGRLHVDTARYDEDQVQFGDGSNVRRIRLEARARVAEDWEAKASIDFADNEVDLKSTYLEYGGSESTDLLIGNFKESFSLEELSSSNDITFMERAMLTEFSPGRNIGIGASRRGSQSTFTAGLFGGGISGDNEDDAGWGTSARVTFFPIFDDDRLLHLGAALAYRETGDDDTYRVRSRPESAITDVRLVDTGDIAGVDDVSLLGLEAAGVMGPFSLQGEYVAAEVSRSGMPNLDFSGWYAYASWVLTGESRLYKPGSGKMGGVIPEHPLGAGGIGAWELAARFSTIDLTDGPVIGGVQDNLTLGLNWYASPNIRFMLNYVDVLDVDRPGAPEDGENPDIIQIRAQFAY